MEKKIYSTEEVSEMLKKTNSKLLQKFIADRIKEDEPFRQALGEYLDKPSTKKATTKNFESTIVRGWQRAIEKAKDKWDLTYLSYSDSSFVDKLQSILKRVRSEAQDTESRISLQLKLLDNFNIRRSYDQWEIHGKTLEDIIEDFHIILETSDHMEGYLVLRKYLFNACLGYLGKFKIEQEASECVEDLESFVIEHFMFDFTEQVKDYINSKIQKALNSEIDSWTRKKIISRYVEEMLNLLSRNNASENELLNYAKDYWEFDDVRRWFISFYKKSSQLDKAIKVLEESAVKEGNLPVSSSYYKKELKELYLLTDDKKKYREILLEEIKETQGPLETEMEMYRELKSLYITEEWVKVREDILSSKVSNPEILVKYFTEDNLHQRLLNLLLADETDYAFFDKYASSLPSEYSQQILAKYENHFLSLLKKAKDRIRYQELLNTLKDAHKISGGKELTDHLTSEWLKRFETRPAFCEELQRFRSENKQTE